MDKHLLRTLLCVGFFILLIFLEVTIPSEVLFAIAAGLGFYILMKKLDDINNNVHRLVVFFEGQEKKGKKKY